MIDRESKLSIGRQARFLGISRGSVYYLPKPVSERDLDLMKRLDRLHLKTLMTGMGIEAVYCKPNTSKKTPGREIYPYLPHGMTINRANRVRALDTTYIPMVKGFVYLTAVVDWASRKVLAAKGFVDAVKNQGCQLSMVGRALGVTMSSLSDCGVRSNTNGFIYMLMIPSAKHALRFWIISSGTTTSDPIPA